MATLRIANLVAHAEDRSTAPKASYEIPAAIIGAGFSVGDVALARRQTMLNDLDRTILELTFVEAGIRAEKEGYDAIFIGPVADYGLRQLRAAVGIPVIGSGQASMQVAAGLGRRFSIVSVWPEILRPAYERQLAENGFSAMCSGIEFVTAMDELSDMLGEHGMINQLGTDKRGALLDRIEASARTAIKTGAEVIILGCTCMSPIADELASRLDGYTVIDPLKVGYKFTEMMVSLGLAHRPSAPSVHAANLSAIVAAVDFGVLADDACGDSCSVMDMLNAEEPVRQLAAATH